LKIVAGMLGVDLDDLKHRERKRRRWRLTALAACGVALLALTSTLAVNAIIARHAAERRQQQAENLVGYMLGDLDDKLREVNRLDILESVADKVVKYFDALPPADVTDDTLAQRAQALLKLGAARRDQGRIPEALEVFKLALASTEQLVRDAPRNVYYQKIHAESLTWVGLVDWSQGQLDDALTRFVAARDALLGANGLAPDDADVLDRLQTAHTNAGRIFEARGQLEDAHREYAQVLDRYSYLSRREPDKLEWKTELGYAHNNLAQLALKEGRLDLAVEEYLADWQIKARLYGLDPANNLRREDLVASEAFLGRVLYLCGETQAAAVHLDAAMTNIEALLKVDPDATDWIEKAGNYGWMVGQIARVRGDWVTAEQRDTASLAHLQQLVAKDHGNVGWLRKLARAEIEDAQRLLAQRQLGAAQDTATMSKALAIRVMKLAPQDINGALDLAQARLVLGDIAAAAGNLPTAQTNWSSAVNALRQRAATAIDPVVLDLWCSALLRLGQLNEASKALAALSRAGYREPDFVAQVTKAGIAYPLDTSASRRIARLIDQPDVADAQARDESKH
ncbi:MAG: hypothetical protein WBW61_12860, partial [Rhodanobacteraceae bacterium]